MERDKENIDSKILDEDFIEIPEGKYLIGDYTLDEALKIFGVLSINIIIIFGSLIMFESNFLANFFLPISGILFFIFWDITEKRKHLRWKIWVLVLTIIYYFFISYIF